MRGSSTVERDKARMEHIERRTGTEEQNVAKIGFNKRKAERNPINPLVTNGILIWEEAKGFLGSGSSKGRVLAQS